MMDAFTVLLTTSIVCIFAYIYTIWKTLKTFQYAGMPYVPGLPFVGNIGQTLLQKTQIAELLQQFYNRFPDAKYFGIFDCTTPVIIIREPELVKQICVKNFDSFSDHLGFSTEADKLWEKTLFSLKGHRWRDMRGLLSPTFTSSKLKQMYGTISSCAIDFAEYLKQSVKQGMTELEVKEFGGKYTNDVICKYAFGINIDSVKNPKNEIYLLGRQIFAFDGPLSLRFFALKSFPWFAKIFRIFLFPVAATEFFTTVIKDTINERDKHNIVNTDMLQILVNASRKSDSKIKVDMVDIISQTFIFFFGGYDTTSSFMSTTLHLLATHPDVMKRLQAEIDALYEKTNGQPTYEEIQNMRFMECVINEVGRLFSPAPYTERLCTKSFELPPAMPDYKPVTVEPGTAFYIPIYALHRDPKYFSDPEKFDPDRFEDRTINYESGYYMPFGMGRRMCIGTRLALITVKVIMFHLLSRVSFKPSSKTLTPMKLATNSWILMSANKYWLQVELRNKHEN